MLLYIIPCNGFLLILIIVHDAMSITPIFDFGTACYHFICVFCISVLLMSEPVRSKPLPTPPTTEPSRRIMPKLPPPVVIQSCNPFRESLSQENQQTVIKTKPALPVPLGDDVCAEFRTLFDLANSEHCYYVFHCIKAGQRLAGGRLMVGEDHVCFYSNLMGRETRDVIRYDKVQRVSSAKVVHSCTV